MPGIGNRTELPQATPHGGCSCCSTHAATPPRQETLRQETPRHETPRQETADAEYLVEGLTCGHCVETVRKAASAVKGVGTAAVELVAGGTSRLRISGSADPAAVREAVSAAGYTISS